MRLMDFLRSLGLDSPEAIGQLADVCLFVT